ncbi:MAG: glycosyl hydrolase [Gammaproteobacteria bacterium]|nr:glycosyl hydrolase [Gammaproteobacteria bacterium]
MKRLLSAGKSRALIWLAAGLWGLALAAGGDPRAGAVSGSAVDPSLYQALQWRNIGPARAGRTTAVAGVPDQPSVFYIGSSGGGIWKTDDAGTNWHNVSDGFFDVGAIGAIAVAPSDPRVIYAGTGEASIRGQTTSPGDGVYKSTDAGKTWAHLGLAATLHIAAIAIDPANPDTVYVAAQGNPYVPSHDRGVYRSRDGGKTWSQVLFVSPSTGAHDLSIDPKDPSVLYAALWDYQRLPWNIRSGGPGSGLWKSTDGGNTWHRLRQGLPALMGNTGVAVSPVDPDRVYAMIEAVHGGVFRSDDAGRTWRRTNGDAGIRDRGWYYTRIYADPQQKDTVYVLANSVVKSTDGGTTFGEIRNPHGDNHDLWIDPRNDKIMVEGNDGGGVVTLDGGRTWSSDLNQPTGQFYRVFADDRFPYWVYAGQQDWGTMSVASSTMHGGIGRQDWHEVGGGESAQIGADPHDPTLVYATGILGDVTEYDARDEQIREIPPYEYFAAFRPPSELKYRANWTPPLFVSSHDPRAIYFGAQVVFKSTDRGTHWQAISPDLTRHELAKEGVDGGPISIEGAGGENYGTLTYMIESPLTAGTLWVGSDDGLVHLTRDDGAHWADVTPRGMNAAEVQSIEASPHDPAKAYLAVSRYKFGDFAPMLYRTDDYGRTWHSIAAGLPADMFVRVVREDPMQTGLLYAGTENGLFISFDDGGHWQPFQLNLPRVPVTDLKIHEGDLVASTEGRAFWVLDDLSSLEQLAAQAGQVKSAGAYLFKPRKAYLLERRGGPPALQAGIGTDSPDGAIIRYELPTAPADASSPVSLEILDDNGRVIRRFTNQPVKHEARSLVKGVIKLPPAPPVPTKAGMNTYVWDLRVAPYTPVSDTIRYVSQIPYRVAPGIYTVRLTYGGQSLTQSLEVANDPRREPVTAAQWAQQQQLLARLGMMVDDIHRSANDMRAVAQQAQALMRRAAGSGQANGIDADGRALIARIARWEEQVPQPKLPHDVQDYVSFPSRLLSTPVLNLITMVDQDPPVTAAAQAEVQDLQARWLAIRSDLARIKRTELARFNARLQKAGLPQDDSSWSEGDPPPPRVVVGAGAVD